MLDENCASRKRFPLHHRDLDFPVFSDDGVGEDEPQTPMGVLDLKRSFIGLVSAFCVHDVTSLGNTCTQEVLLSDL